jgi:hypothetical protein
MLGPRINSDRNVPIYGISTTVAKTFWINPGKRVSKLSLIADAARDRISGARRNEIAFMR